MSPYREMDELDQANATVAILEKENAQLQWRLIQMGNHVQLLGGRSKDAYGTGIAKKIAMVIMLVIFTGFMLFLAVRFTNTAGCV